MIKLIIIGHQDRDHWGPDGDCDHRDHSDHNHHQDSNDHEDHDPNDLDDHDPNDHDDHDHLALHPDLRGVPGHPNLARDSSTTESDKEHYSCNWHEGRVLFFDEHDDDDGDKVEIVQ